jgi:hypothetical protein
MRAILFFLLLLCSPGLVQAKYLTPELLFENINSGDCNKYNQAYGYILGVYDAFEGVIYMHHEDLKPDTLVDVVDKYIKQHRGEHYYSAQLMVLRALEEYVKNKEMKKKNP